MIYDKVLLLTDRVKSLEAEDEFATITDEWIKDFETMKNSYESVLDISNNLKPSNLNGGIKLCSELIAMLQKLSS